MNRSLLSILMLLACALAPVSAVVVSFPSVEIPYQGLAIGPDGVRYDGDVAMRFELYDALTDGSQIWDSGVVTVTADRGVVSYRLGSNTDLAVITLQLNTELYLQVTIDGEVVTPRRPLDHVPYAAVAESIIADGVKTGSIADNAVTAEHIADGAVTSAAIATGAITSDDIATDGVTASDIAANAIDSARIVDGSITGGDMELPLDLEGDETSYLFDVRNTNTTNGNGVFVSTDGESGQAMVLRNRGSGGIFWGYTFEAGASETVFRIQNNTWVTEPVSWTPDTIMRLNGAGNLYVEGTVNPGGADFAEAMDASNALVQHGREPESGDVMMIDVTGQRAVTIAAEARTTLVAGVYATKPGILGSEPGHDLDVPGYMPMAMVGIVPTKVSAENGAIATGDLLVVSSTLGHAMRADRPAEAGTVIGKALESFDGSADDTGVIRVLLSLQ